MNRLLPKYWAYQRLSILPIARDPHYFQIIYIHESHTHTYTLESNKRYISHSSENLNFTAIAYHLYPISTSCLCSQSRYSCSIAFGFYLCRQSSSSAQMLITRRSCTCLLMEHRCIKHTAITSYIFARINMLETTAWFSVTI